MSKSIVLPLLALLGTASAAQAQNLTKRLDFSGRSQSTFKTSGVDFFFSDVPVNQLVNGRDLSRFPGKTLPERLVSELASPIAEENLYQLTQVYNRLDSKVSGQVVAYHNRSDDTDVNMQVVVGNKAGETLKPNTTYLVSAKLEFYTSASNDSFGVGGSPDSNSFGLVVSQNPWIAQKELPKPSKPTVPTQPEEPVSTEAPYFGIAPKFFVEQDEIKDIAESTFPTLNEKELNLVASKVKVSPTQGPDAFRKAMLQVIVDMANQVLVEMAKPVAQQVFADSLSKRLSVALDSNIQAKLAEMSPEDIQNLKDMFGGSGDPVFLMASAPSAMAVEDGVSMLRTYTKDNEGKVRPLGVPSGDCSADRPERNEDEEWLCSRYSYMGRINNGGLPAGTWSANSISTSSPVEITTDASGRPLYLNLASHSGFEGLTIYYVKAIEYRLVEKK